LNYFLWSLPGWFVYKSAPFSVDVPKSKTAQSSLPFSTSKDIFNMAHSIQEEHPLHDQPRQSVETTEKPSEVQEDESHFPTGAKLVVIVISILFAMFLVALV
jgi:hypothetical protein